ncbi:MAG: hypothetical protein AMS15_00265 [Planctomycetes bacterium DG_23]|nr:MAG: hypothetical protein AMS15_00265 [Planctomycetes bacterium DG_23]
MSARTLLCVPITAETTEAAILDMYKAEEVADMVELRLDYIHDLDLGRLLGHKALPVIATCRPVSEGGRFAGDQSSRLRLLQDAVGLGADFVDIELEAWADFKARGKSKRIVSYHNLTETPANLDSIVKSLRSTDAHIIKIATTATSILDNLVIFDLLQKSKRAMIALCMGEDGLISRVLAPKFGSFLTFAALSEGKESAPGQLPAAELKSLYRFNEINKKTEIYGVIGNPIAHSMSPAIHNAAFGHLGLNKVYLPFRVDDVVAFVEAFKAVEVKGYSVTIPHKENVIAALDEVDELAQKIGAVNTVVEKRARLIGSNTDSSAAIFSLEQALGESPEGVVLSGKRVVVLGAGGAARAIAFGLRQCGAKTTILNRTVKRAKRLAEEVGAQWGPLSDASKVEMDILVNATSVGMYPEVDETPVDKEVFRPGLVVFDMIYNPLEARLLREAKDAGCKCVSGLDMFVEQAKEQFELWTGKKAPTDLMRQIVLERLGER